MSSKNFSNDDLGTVRIDFSLFSFFKLFKSVPRLVEEHVFTYNALQKQQMDVLQKSLKKTCKTPIRAGNSEAPCPYFFLNSETYEGSGGFLPKFYTDKRKMALEVSSFTHNTAFVDSLIKSICIFQLKRRENSGFMRNLSKRIQGRKEFEYDPISLFCEEFKSWAVEFESASSKEQARKVLAERLEYIEQILNHVNLFEFPNQTISFVSLLSTLNNIIQQQLPLYHMSMEEGLENLVMNAKCIVENGLEFAFFINLCTKKTPPKIFVARDLLAVEPYAEYLTNTRGSLLTHCFSTTQMESLLSYDFCPGEITDQIETFRRNMRTLRKKPVTAYPIVLSEKVQLLDSWWTNKDSEKVGIFIPFCTKPHVDAYLEIIASLVHISQALKLMNFVQHSPSHLKESILSANKFDVFLIAFTQQLQKLGQNIQFLKTSAKEVNMQLDTKSADIVTKNWREGLSAISSTVDKISAAFDVMKSSLIFLREVSVFKRSHLSHYEDEQGILKTIQKTLGDFVKYLPANSNNLALTYSLPALQSPIQLQRSSHAVQSLVLASSTQSSGFSYREVVGVISTGICIDLCLDGTFAFSSSLLWSSAIGLMYYFRTPIQNFAMQNFSTNTQLGIKVPSKNVTLTGEQKEQQLIRWAGKLAKYENNSEINDIIVLRNVCMYAGLLRQSSTVGNRSQKLLRDYLPEYINRLGEDLTVPPAHYLTLQMIIVRYFIKNNDYINAANACANILNYSKSHDVPNYQYYEQLATKQLRYIEDQDKGQLAMIAGVSNFSQ